MAIWAGLGVAGFGVIAALAVVAVRQLKALRQQNLAIQEEHAKLSRHCCDSIRVLAGSYLAKQISASEAALRIAVLLDQPSLDFDARASQLREQGSAFTEMAEAVKHIPTHGAWKKLSPEQRGAFSKEMEAAESVLGARLEVSAQVLLDLL